MTKMFVGASVMMLVDEGKLGRDDPVIKYIPQLSKWMVVEEKDESDAEFLWQHGRKEGAWVTMVVQPMFTA
jgi:CubicO group peptidase (beta-lactamase class C family)